jgi:hypothetical protein
VKSGAKGGKMAKIADIAGLNPATGSVYQYAVNEEEGTGDLVAQGYAYIIQDNQTVNSSMRRAKSVLDTLQSIQVGPGSWDVSMVLNGQTRHFTVVAHNQPEGSDYYWGSVTEQGSGHTLNYLYVDFAPFPIVAVAAVILGGVLLICVALLVIDPSHKECLNSCAATCRSQGKTMKKAEWNRHFSSPTQGCGTTCNCECG